MILIQIMTSLQLWYLYLDWSLMESDLDTSTTSARNSMMEKWRRWALGTLHGIETLHEAHKNICRLRKSKLF